MSERCPTESLDPDYDDGTMPHSVLDLANAVVGHRIVNVEKTSLPPSESSWWGRDDVTVITLDNQERVILRNTDDCCAYTELESFLLHADQIDHIITGVGTTNDYQTWHIFADMGDVLELTVGWSAGNAFYYGYGFAIEVESVPAEATSA